MQTEIFAHFANKMQPAESDTRLDNKFLSDYLVKHPFVYRDYIGSRKALCVQSLLHPLQQTLCTESTASAATDFVYRVLIPHMKNFRIFTDKHSINNSPSTGSTGLTCVCMMEGEVAFCPSIMK